MIVLPVLIGLGVFFIALYPFTYTGDETNFDELALGKETQIYRATYQGVPIHCNDLSESVACLEGWRNRGGHNVILWLGNSQLHAINQMKPIDVNAVQILRGKLAKNGNELLAFSQPNANLQEHYLLFEYLKGQLPISTLLLPVVFDDTRENGLRDGLVEALAEQDVVDELKKTTIGLEILAENKSLKAGGDLAGLNDTPQMAVEAGLTTWLTEHWSLWEARPQMRGEIFRNLYVWRNSIFGINAQSKRKKIPGRYVKNLAAVEATLQSSLENNIHVILYIVPLRSDVESPYLAREYVDFKKDLALLASKNNAVFANLDDLVPGSLWGRKDTTSANGEVELDFMHFQAGGHLLLADAMFELLQQNHFLDDGR